MTTQTAEVRLISAPQMRAEVRAETDEKRKVLHGVLVPYDTPTDIGGAFVETIAPGCFTKSIKESARRLPLMAAHDIQSWPIGSADEWDDTAERLAGLWTLADGPRPLEVWELVRDGHLSALSVGFQPFKSDWTFSDRPGELDSVRRREARLLEASVVSVGAYEAARVQVRTAEGRIRKTPRLDQWRDWLAREKAGR